MQNEPANPESPLSFHVHHRFPHPEFEERLMIELASVRMERDKLVDRELHSHEARLTGLEKFRYLVLGGLIVSSSIVGSGVFGFFGHRLGLW